MRITDMTAWSGFAPNTAKTISDMPPSSTTWSSTFGTAIGPGCTPCAAQARTGAPKIGLGGISALLTRASRRKCRKRPKLSADDDR